MSLSLQPTTSSAATTSTFVSAADRIRVLPGAPLTALNNEVVPLEARAFPPKIIDQFYVIGSAPSDVAFPPPSPLARASTLSSTLPPPAHFLYSSPTGNPVIWHQPLSILSHAPAHSPAGVSAAEVLQFALPTPLPPVVGLFDETDPTTASPAYSSDLLSILGKIGLPRFFTPRTLREFFTSAYPHAPPGNQLVPFSFRTSDAEGGGKGKDDKAQRLCTAGTQGDIMYGVALTTYSFFSLPPHSQQQGQRDDKNGLNPQTLPCPTIALVPRVYVVTSRYPFYSFLSTTLRVVASLCASAQLVSQLSLWVLSGQALRAAQSSPPPSESQAGEIRSQTQPQSSSSTPLLCMSSVIEFPPPTSLILPHEVPSCLAFLKAVLLTRMPSPGFCLSLPLPLPPLPSPDVWQALARLVSSASTTAFVTTQTTETTRHGNTHGNAQSHNPLSSPIMANNRHNNHTNSSSAFQFHSDPPSGLLSPPTAASIASQVASQTPGFVPIPGIFYSRLLVTSPAYSLGAYITSHPFFGTEIPPEAVFCDASCDFVSRKPPLPRVLVERLSTHPELFITFHRPHTPAVSLFSRILPSLASMECKGSFYKTDPRNGGDPYERSPLPPITLSFRDLEERVSSASDAQLLPFLLSRFAISNAVLSHDTLAPTFYAPSRLSSTATGRTVLVPSVFPSRLLRNETEDGLEREYAKVLRAMSKTAVIVTTWALRIPYGLSILAHASLAGTLAAMARVLEQSEHHQRVGHPMPVYGPPPLVSIRRRQQQFPQYPQHSQYSHQLERAISGSSSRSYSSRQDSEYGNGQENREEYLSPHQLPPTQFSHQAYAGTSASVVTSFFEPATGATVLRSPAGNFYQYPTPSQLPIDTGAALDQGVLSPFSASAPNSNSTSTFTLASTFSSNTNVIPAESLVDLLEYALQEYTLLVCDPSPSVASSCVSFFHTLLLPMEWPYPAIPLLPDSLSEMIESPVPALLGLTSLPSWLTSPNDLPEKTVVWFPTLDHLIWVPPAVPSARMGILKPAIPFRQTLLQALEPLLKMVEEAIRSSDSLLLSPSEVEAETGRFLASRFTSSTPASLDFSYHRTVYAPVPSTASSPSVTVAAATAQVTSLINGYLFALIHGACNELLACYVKAQTAVLDASQRSEQQHQFQQQQQQQQYVSQNLPVPVSTGLSEEEALERLSDLDKHKLLHAASVLPALDVLVTGKNAERGSTLLSSGSVSNGNESQNMRARISPSKTASAKSGGATYPRTTTHGGILVEDENDDGDAGLDTFSAVSSPKHRQAAMNIREVADVKVSQAVSVFDKFVGRVKALRATLAKESKDTFSSARLFGASGTGKEGISYLTDTPPDSFSFLHLHKGGPQWTRSRFGSLAYAFPFTNANTQSYAEKMAVTGFPLAERAFFDEFTHQSQMLSYYLQVTSERINQRVVVVSNERIQEAHRALLREKSASMYSVKNGEGGDSKGGVGGGVSGYQHNSAQTLSSYPQSLQSLPQQQQAQSQFAFATPTAAVGPVDVAQPPALHSQYSVGNLPFTRMVSLNSMSHDAHVVPTSSDVYSSISSNPPVYSRAPTVSTVDVSSMHHQINRAFVSQPSQSSHSNAMNGFDPTQTVGLRMSHLPPANQTGEGMRIDPYLGTMTRY